MPEKFHSPAMLPNDIRPRTQDLLGWKGHRNSRNGPPGPSAGTGRPALMMAGQIKSPREASGKEKFKTNEIQNIHKNPQPSLCSKQTFKACTLPN